jgi:hypothetical protein
MQVAQGFWAGRKYLKIIGLAWLGIMAIAGLLGCPAVTRVTKLPFPPV